MRLHLNLTEGKANVIVDTLYTPGEKEFSRNLKFVISIGKKTRVRKISFSGNSIFSDGKFSILSHNFC